MSRSKVSAPHWRVASRVSCPHLSACSSSLAVRSFRFLTRGTTDCLVEERWRGAGSLEDTMSSISSMRESQAESMIWKINTQHQHWRSINTLHYRVHHKYKELWAWKIYITHEITGLLFVCLFYFFYLQRKKIVPKLITLLIHFCLHFASWIFYFTLFKNITLLLLCSK